MVKMRVFRDGEWHEDEDFSIQMDYPQVAVYEKGAFARWENCLTGEKITERTYYPADEW